MRKQKNCSYLVLLHRFVKIPSQQRARDKVASLHSVLVASCHLQMRPLFSPDRLLDILDESKLLRGRSWNSYVTS